MQNHRSTSSLCAELPLLVQEAEEIKWPFVPEKWPYRHPGQRGPVFIRPQSVQESAPRYPPMPLQGVLKGLKDDNLFQ
ncbi:unnamed protein product [Gadus morhua 'NCC']